MNELFIKKRIVDLELLLKEALKAENDYYIDKLINEIETLKGVLNGLNQD